MPPDTATHAAMSRPVAPTRSRLNRAGVTRFVTPSGVMATVAMLTSPESAARVARAAMDVRRTTGPTQSSWTCKWLPKNGIRANNGNEARYAAVPSPAPASAWLVVSRTVMSVA